MFCQMGGWCSYDYTAWAPPEVTYTSNKKSSPATPGPSSSKEIDPEAAAAVFALMAAGVAAVTMAAVGTVYGSYQGVKFLVDKKRGPQENNHIIAGAITGGLWASLGLGILGYQGHQEHLKEIYPAMSMYVNNQFKVGIGMAKDRRQAAGIASDRCDDRLFSSCTEVIATPAGSPICISFAPHKNGQNYFIKTFDKDHTDPLSLAKAECALAKTFSKSSVDVCGIGAIQYYCNTKEMDGTVAKLESGNKDVDAALANMPYSPPLQPQPKAWETPRTTPNFGAGIQFLNTPQGAVIKGLVQDGPAMKAGLATGDTIVQIDTVTAPGASNETVYKMLSASDRNTVHIEVIKAGTNEKYSVSMSLVKQDNDPDYIEVNRVGDTPKIVGAYIDPNPKPVPAPKPAYLKDMYEISIRSKLWMTPSTSGAAWSGKVDKGSCFFVYNEGGTKDFAKISGRTDKGLYVDGFVKKGTIHPVPESAHSFDGCRIHPVP